MQYFTNNHCDAPGVDVTTQNEEELAQLVRRGHETIQGARRGGIAKGVPAATIEKWQRKADELFTRNPALSLSRAAAIIAEEWSGESQDHLDGRAFSDRTIRRYLEKR